MYFQIKIDYCNDWLVNVPAPRMFFTNKTPHFMSTIERRNIVVKQQTHCFITYQTFKEQVNKLPLYFKPHNLFFTNKW